MPFEERRHVGSWMVPSVDPELNLVYVGTSVTSPTPKFLLGGTDLTHLYHNSTLALDADTGEIVWYYQHMNDHWTSTTPSSACSWTPRCGPTLGRGLDKPAHPAQRGAARPDGDSREDEHRLHPRPRDRRVLWARPTITQNVVSGIDRATGAATENAELIFTAAGQQVIACPHASGGKDWDAGVPPADQHHVHVASQRLRAHGPLDDGGRSLYSLSMRNEFAPGRTSSPRSSARSSTVLDEVCSTLYVAGAAKCCLPTPRSGSSGRLRERARSRAPVGTGRDPAHQRGGRARALPAAVPDGDSPARGAPGRRRAGAGAHDGPAVNATPVGDGNVTGARLRERRPE